MLPSEFIAEVVKATKAVEGIEDVLAYEPTPEGVIYTTAWVDLESLTRSAQSIDAHWEAEATVRITVAVPQDADPRIRSKIEAWDLAYAVGAHLINQRWGSLKTEPAQLLGIDRAILQDFEGHLDACEVLLSQQLYLPTANPSGQGLWVTNPSVVWASIVPDVGPAHIDDYTKVSEYP